MPIRDWVTSIKYEWRCHPEGCHYHKTHDSLTILQDHTTKQTCPNKEWGNDATNQRGHTNQWRNTQTRHLHMRWRTMNTLKETNAFYSFFYGTENLRKHNRGSTTTLILKKGWSLSSLHGHGEFFTYCSIKHYLNPLFMTWSPTNWYGQMVWKSVPRLFLLKETRQ